MVSSVTQYCEYGIKNDRIQESNGTDGWSPQYRCSTDDWYSVVFLPLHHSLWNFVLFDRCPCFILTMGWFKSSSKKTSKLSTVDDLSVPTTSTETSVVSPLRQLLDGMSQQSFHSFYGILQVNGSFYQYQFQYQYCCNCSLQLKFYFFPLMIVVFIVK